MNFGGSEKWESVFGVLGFDVSVFFVYFGNLLLIECCFSLIKLFLGF